MLNKQTAIFIIIIILLFLHSTCYINKKKDKLEDISKEEYTNTITETPKNTNLTQPQKLTKLSPMIPIGENLSTHSMSIIPALFR